MGFALEDYQQFKPTADRMTQLTSGKRPGARYSGPALDKAYRKPRILSEAEKTRFASNGSQARYRRDWQTAADFQYWASRNPKHGLTPWAEDDIDQDGVNDFVVYQDRDRREPIAVNGTMLFPSKYAPYQKDGLFERQLTMRKAYRTMYSASLKSIRDDLKARVKLVYPRFITAVRADARELVHQYANVKAVSDAILKGVVFGPMDVQFGITAETLPALVARTHNSRVYKEAAEKAYAAWIEPHAGQLLEIIAAYAEVLCGGEIVIGGGALYDQIRKARAGRKERNLPIHEIIRAWTGLPDYLRNLVIGAVKAEDRDTYLGQLAAQDQLTAAAVAELVPLGIAAKDHGSPDFQPPAPQE